jgi:PTS system cellobiose-specific IIC component
MNNIFGLFEKYFLPVAGKLGSQRHLVAIRDGFSVILPLILVGSFAVLINNLPIPFFQHFMANLFGSKWTDVGNFIWNGTFAVMAILVCIGVSYSLARSYNVDPLAAALVALSSVIVVTPVTKDGGLSLNWLGAKGLFVVLIVTIISTEIFRKLVQMKLVIKMPDGVPPAVARSFAALIPGILVLIVFGLVQVLFIDVFGKSMHEIIYSTLQQPFQHLSNTLIAVLIVEFAKSFLWFFGLHGSNILGPIIDTMYLPPLQENIKLFQQGVSAMDVPNIVSTTFMDVYVAMGGTGTGITLLIALLIIAKAKQFRSLGKMATPAALFNINEPLIFGLPIVLNPVLFIPFILVPLVNVTIAYLATAAGLVPKVVALVPWTTPPLIGGYLATGGSIAGSILQLVNIFVGVLIYLPFVRVLDKQATKNAMVTPAVITDDKPSINS